MGDEQSVSWYTKRSAKHHRQTNPHTFCWCSCGAEYDCHKNAVITVHTCRHRYKCISKTTPHTKLDINVGNGKTTFGRIGQHSSNRCCACQDEFSSCHHISRFRQRPQGKSRGKMSTFVRGSLPRLHRVVTSVDVVQLHTMRSPSKDRCTVHWATLVRGFRFPRLILTDLAGRFGGCG